MDDPMFPILAGAALTEGVRFVYNQMGLLIERRRLTRQGDVTPPEGTPELPPSVSATGPLRVDDAVVEEREAEIQMLHSLLSVSQSRENLDGSEPQLRIIMARAQEVLEAVYHQQLDFSVHTETASVGVNQRFEDVQGDLVGGRVDEINQGGHLEVDQTVDRLHESGSATGAVVKRVG